LALLIKPLQIDFRNQDQREPVSKGEGAPNRGRLRIESEEMENTEGYFRYYKRY
jgi:hypothetical protein